jgi:hypothetical protein
MERYNPELESFNDRKTKIPEAKNRLWLNDNRIILSILFGMSGLIFLVLMLDSHYKSIKRETMTGVLKGAFGSKNTMSILKEIKNKLN